MKKYSLIPALALAVSLSGCTAIEGIFKAGLWSGIIFVVIIIAVIIFALRALTRKK